MKGYRFSKDYERLFELVQKQDVIVATPSLFKHYVLCRAQKETFIGNNSKEQFIEKCKKENLSFIDPSDTEELAEALREVIEKCKRPYNFKYYDDVVVSNLFEKASALLKKYGASNER